MITQANVRAHFEAKHEWMVDILRGQFGNRFGRRNVDALNEAIQNTVALAFENATRCAANGKIHDADDLERYTKQSLWWAIRHTCAGRSIVAKPSADALNGDVYEKMTPRTTPLDAFIGKNTPVPDAVSFRVDVPALLATLTDRQRAMADDLMSGMSTKELAEKRGITPSYVSQFRTRFHVLWNDFFAEV